VLAGYANFLREKDVALPQRQSYLVRWVREFLLFAQERSGYTFEQTLDLFLSEIAACAPLKPGTGQDREGFSRYKIAGRRARRQFVSRS